MKNTKAKEMFFGNRKKMVIFLAVDTCLDSGGRWNDVLNACEMPEQNP